MNRRQGLVLVTAVVAILAVSLAAGVVSQTRATTTGGGSSGVFTEENVSLAEQPDPASLNLSQIPWLEAYFQFYEPGNQTARSNPGGGSGGTTSLFSIIVGTAVIVGVLGVVVLACLWLLVRRTDSSADLSATAPPKDTDPDASDGHHTAHAGVPPSNDIYRAWQTMVRHVGVPVESGHTPREVAGVAVERGFDQESVETLTDLFERVRYGGDPPTADLESRAVRALERLGLDRET